MGILAKSKEKVFFFIYSKGEKGGMGEGGYVSEFVNFVFQPLLSLIIQKKVKIITNAGGKHFS
jgi:hypothetical protein